jgi:hypothetical protein
MYKARFQQWGIEKKIKAEDAVEIFRQQTARAKAGKPSVAYVRGRKITPDRLQRYRYVFLTNVFWLRTGQHDELKGSGRFLL